MLAFRSLLDLILHMVVSPVIMDAVVSDIHQKTSPDYAAGSW
jgi:hypothetical protein